LGGDRGCSYRDDKEHATQMRGPFIHLPGDDDSAAVTFWAADRARLRKLLQNAIDAIDGEAP
jgi:hypothetical protein